MTTHAASSPAAPDTYLGVEVPEEIKKNWFRWEGASWRRMRYLGTNNPFPPDERYTVRMPAGMCATHREHWLGYRNMDFDPVSGNRWPGGAGSPFNPIGRDLARVREERRCEWDEKASEQMRLIERICLSGNSPECSKSEPGHRPAS
ncbi:hypothetical protein ACWDBD_19610 [Streptomyces sp. NPDC001118]